jgi:hypothetical protein
MYSIQAASHEDKSKWLESRKPAHHATAKEQAEHINRMLMNLKTKSFREKIDDAYDGAVKTHEIGFPSSVTDRGSAGKKEPCGDRQDER